MMRRYEACSAGRLNSKRAARRLIGGDDALSNLNDGVQSTGDAASQPLLEKPNASQTEISRIRSLPRGL
jgi:hypothetical protein